MTTTQTSLVDVIKTRLETMHPEATVAVDNPTSADFQICSLGDVTAVIEHGEASLTTDDIMHITIPERNPSITKPVDYKESDDHHLFRQ